MERLYKVRFWVGLFRKCLRIGKVFGIEFGGILLFRGGENEEELVRKKENWSGR